MSGFFAFPLVIFFIFVAPLWLFLHYRSKGNSAQGLSHEAPQLLKTLSEGPATMRRRVEI